MVKILDISSSFTFESEFLDDLDLVYDDVSLANSNIKKKSKFYVKQIIFIFSLEFRTK